MKGLTFVLTFLVACLASAQLKTQSPNNDDSYNEQKARNENEEILLPVLAAQREKEQAVDTSFFIGGTRRQLRQGQRQGSARVDSRALQTGTVMPICGRDADYSVPHGFQFQAPTTISIVGLRMANEIGHSVQNVQVFLRDSAVSSPTSVPAEGSVFHAVGIPPVITIATDICVPAGKHVVILGSTSTGAIDRASSCFPASYTTNIAGMSTTIHGMRTLQKIHPNPATTYETEPDIGRIFMHYTLDCASNPPSTSPSTSPSSRPSNMLCLGDNNCGNCNEGRIDGIGGCNCPGCERSVCANDDYCCNTEWDRDCAKEAEYTCNCVKSNPPSAIPTNAPSKTAMPSNQPTTTSQPSFSPRPSTIPSASPSDFNCHDVGLCGDCNQASSRMGCGCPYCQDLVCATDSHCCSIRWDRQCARLAEDVCHCPLPGSPTKKPSRRPTSRPTSSGVPSQPTEQPSTRPNANYCGNCNEPRWELGCSCADCESAVCEIDRYCCSGGWDRRCAEQADVTCRCRAHGSTTLPPTVHK